MAVLYRPVLQWQGDPKDDDPLGWYDCTAFAAAIGVDAVSAGAIRTSGGEVRRLTDEPTLEPKDPGLNLAQVRAACERFGMGYLDRQGRTWDAFLADVRTRWCVVTVWYPDMGSLMHQRPGAFGHAMGAMAVSSTGDKTLLYDPLVSDGRPEWASLAQLRKAMEAWGSRTGLPGRVRYLASEALIPKI